MCVNRFGRVRWTCIGRRDILPLDADSGYRPSVHGVIVGRKRPPSRHPFIGFDLPFRTRNILAVAYLRNNVSTDDNRYVHKSRSKSNSCEGLARSACYVEILRHQRKAIIVFRIFV